jgi:hypothetical protein
MPLTPEWKSTPMLGAALTVKAPELNLLPVMMAAGVGSGCDADSETKDADFLVFPPRPVPLYFNSLSADVCSRVKTADRPNDSPRIETRKRRNEYIG